MVQIKIIYLTFSVTLFSIFPYGHNLMAQNAKEIVEKADKKRMGNTSQSTMRLTVIRPNWQREMSLKVWTKGNQYLLILINDPVRDKGTTFLKRDKEFWNWVPRIERSVKLPPSAMTQAWMGSDFSNDDLVKMSSIIEDYEHTLIGEELIEDRMAYKIEMIPKEEAAVVWGKIISWIDKSESLFLKTQYYDEDNELINTMYGSEIKIMDGRSVTTRVEIQPADVSDQKTILVYSELKFDKSIPDNFFSLQNMKRIK